MTKTFGLTFVLTSLAASSAARADDPPTPADAPVATEPATDAPRPKPLYTSPFQLRGMFPKTGLRLDTTVGRFQVPAGDARITVLFFSGQWHVAEPVALQVRWGINTNQTGGDTSRAGVTNPTIGVLGGVPVGRDFRFATSFAVGVPVATGGGDNPDPNQVALQRQGALVRSALDNTSFALNDVGLPAGASFAFVKMGITAQIDATITPSIRVKARATQSDSYKVNSTYGFFLGYAFVSEFSLGAELRYQRYITTPAAVERDPSARENLTVAGGARFSFEVRDSIWIRPAISYGSGLRGPVEQQGFHMVQIDVPVSF
jgi:hypothetical protein